MSAPVTTIKARLDALERMPSSTNGNPRYMAVFVNDEGSTVAYTKPDSSYGYSISNHKGSEVAVSLQMYRGKLSIVSLRAANGL